MELVELVEALEDQVRPAIYRFFTENGRAPVPTELAPLLGLSAADVERAFGRLAEQHIITLLPGSSYIWMANPFSNVPTDFAVEVGDKRWWANCIWDAFGILAALSAQGTISTHCPDCSLPIRIDTADLPSEDLDLVVHFAVPAKQWWDEIGHT